MFGLVFGVFGMLAYDGERVRESGMFQGYNSITWTVVILQVKLTAARQQHTSQLYCQSSEYHRLFVARPHSKVSAHRLCLCPSVFVVSPGAGGSGHRSGHQVRRQHPQRLCYVALHHSVNADIVLLAPGLRPNQVQEAAPPPPYLIFVFTSHCSRFCLQRVLLGGRFSHRGHFPVRLRRQALPQPQQGVGQWQPTHTAVGGGGSWEMEGRGWKIRGKVFCHILQVWEVTRPRAGKGSNQSKYIAVKVSHTRSASDDEF